MVESDLKVDQLKRQARERSRPADLEIAAAVNEDGDELLCGRGKKRKARPVVMETLFLALSLQRIRF